MISIASVSSANRRLIFSVAIPVQRKGTGQRGQPTGTSRRTPSNGCRYQSNVGTERFTIWLMLAGAATANYYVPYVIH